MHWVTLYRRRHHVTPSRSRPGLGSPEADQDSSRRGALARMDLVTALTDYSNEKASVAASKALADNMNNDRVSLSHLVQSVESEDAVVDNDVDPWSNASVKDIFADADLQIIKTSCLRVIANEPITDNF